MCLRGNKENGTQLGEISDLYCTLGDSKFIGLSSIVEAAIPEFDL